MDLSKYIGETNSYEKKVKVKKKTDQKSWLKTVVAFANMNGGKIFLVLSMTANRLIGLENAKRGFRIN